MGAPRLLPRRRLFLVAAAGLFAVTSCSAILGLEELPLRPEADGAAPAVDGTAPPALDGSPADAPGIDAIPADATADGDGAPPMCDPTKLMSDPINCGACKRVCRAACTAAACDADRLASVPGAPRGLFVAGNTVYFATLDGTTATLASCPVAGPCDVPTVLRREAADDVRLLAALPAPVPTLVFSLLARTTGTTSFFSCEAGACATAAAVRTEAGTVADALDVFVTGLNHWIFYTTPTTGVAYSVTNNFPRALSPLALAQLLGHNAKYLWARQASGFQRVTLDSATLSTTGLPLTDFPDSRQFAWNGGDTVFVSNASTFVCAGATSDCVSRTGCAVSPAPQPFAFDLTSVLYVRGGEIVTAPYDTPCAPQKVLSEATPALPATGRSTALEATHAVWIEPAGGQSYLFRRPR